MPESVGVSAALLYIRLTGGTASLILEQSPKARDREPQGSVE